ncbi:hypothetical protein MWH25_07190 [Natroniella acetigena]|uniref:hypothetical protein n=1 Tax=Natroniella acetigena TaxID=52004 RepID=UPI00200ADD37|nr:hypothetical protein [Natroniella acetigena]MCK8827525.1 hypothetical protein [Natroniella acetigena]
MSNLFKNKLWLIIAVILGSIFIFNFYTLANENGYDDVYQLVTEEIPEILSEEGISFDDGTDDVEVFDLDKRDGQLYDWQTDDDQVMVIRFEIDASKIDEEDEITDENVNAEEDNIEDWLNDDKFTFSGGAIPGDINLRDASLDEDEDVLTIYVGVEVTGNIFTREGIEVRFEEETLFRFIVTDLYSNPVISSNLIIPDEDDEDISMTVEHGEVYYLPDPGERTWDMITEFRSAGGIATGLIARNMDPLSSSDDPTIENNGYFSTPATTETVSIDVGVTQDYDSFNDMLEAFKEFDEDDFMGHFDVEDYEDEFDPQSSEFEAMVEQGMDVVFVAMLADGYATASDEYANARYYFVFDDASPTINLLQDRYESRNPEIRVEIDDEDGSGIASESPMDYYENTNIRYIRRDQLGTDDRDRLDDAVGHIEEEQFDIYDDIFSRDEARYMQVIDLEDRIEGSERNNPQEAVFTPWGEDLEEGNYFVFVEVEDMAGNPGRKVFEIEIDQSEPRIHTPRLNDEVIGEGTIVGADELNLYFEVSGVKDVIYGIRYTGEDGDKDNDWLIFGEFDLDYSRNEIENDFLADDNSNFPWMDGDEAKAGDYEIFILADEERIKYIEGIDDDDMKSVEEELEAGEIYEIDGDLGGEAIIEVDDQKIDIGSGRAEEKRAWEEWIDQNIEVDATIPEYQTGSIKYVPLDQFGREGADYRELETGDGTRMNTAGDEPDDIDDLYQVRTPDPIFRLQVRNSSNIDTSDVNIYFLQRISRSDDDDEVGVRVRAGIIDHTVDDDNIHTIYFSPSLSLGEGRAGAYDIQLSIRDEFGNQLGGIEELDRISEADEFDTEEGMDEINGRISNLFRIDTVEADIDFSIRSGQSLNTNESSAMEINLDPDSNFEPGDSLRIYINDALIVGPQEGEEEVKVWDREGELYRAVENSDYYEEGAYYTDDSFDPDGFDIMTFNDMHRIILFSRRPFATGRNEIRVAVRTEEGEIAERSISFVAENYREGFGFGRLLIQDND